MKQQADQDDVIGLSLHHASAHGSACFDILGSLQSDEMFSKPTQKPSPPSMFVQGQSLHTSVAVQVKMMMICMNL
jgi:hypothetical protein